MSEGQTLELIGETANYAEFRLVKSDDTRRALHKELKQHVLQRAKYVGLNDNESQAVWVATVEGVWNAVKYGTPPGEAIRIRLSAVGKSSMEVEIEQPLEWLDWEKELGGDRRGTIPQEIQEVKGVLSGGTIIMLKLADEPITVEEDRKVIMRFSHVPLPEEAEGT